MHSDVLRCQILIWLRFTLDNAGFVHNRVREVRCEFTSWKSRPRPQSTWAAFNLCWLFSILLAPISASADYCRLVLAPIIADYCPAYYYCWSQSAWAWVPWRPSSQDVGAILGLVRSGANVPGMDVSRGRIWGWQIMVDLPIAACDQHVIPSVW